MTTAAQLAEAHRIAQLRIGSLTVVQMNAIWPLLDPTDLDGSFPAWVVAAMPIITQQQATSSRVAAAYFTAAKVLQLGPAAAPAAVVTNLADAKAVTTSLLITGPASIKRAMLRGVQLEQAVSTAEASSSAAAMRHSLAGGRETLLRSVRKDPDARGWVRVSSGNACDFCSMLDGKFHRDDTADFPAHDGCSCSQEPVFG